MTGAIYESEMVQHARAEQQRGQALMDHHRADELGLCKPCGRVHPCADYEAGRRLVAEFTPPPTPEPFSRAPYWRNGGRP